MSLIQFTRNYDGNYDDLSTDRGYQFKFLLRGLIGMRRPQFLYKACLLGAGRLPVLPRRQIAPITTDPRDPYRKGDQRYCACIVNRQIN